MYQYCPHYSSTFSTTPNNVCIGICIVKLFTTTGTTNSNLNCCGILHPRVAHQFLLETSDANDCRILSIRIADRNSSSVTLPTSRIPCTSITHTVQREKNLYNSCILSTEFDRPPNLVRDKGIYSARAGSIYRSVGPA